MNITPYIEDIERRLDEKQEQAIYDAWAEFAMGRNTDAPFTPPVRTPVDSELAWKHVNVNDALEDMDLMLLSQLERCHVALTTPSNMPMIMRANYGVGNIASMFGARRFVMAYEKDTLPNVFPMGEAAVKRILNMPAPGMEAGNCPQIFAMAERFAEIREKYPKIARFVRIDHPDAQGPMDNCELIWGSGIFYALYDAPETVHGLLRRITDVMAAFLDRWYALTPSDDGMVSYFGRLAPGGIVVRDDSAMNLSPEFFDGFIRPYDGELLEHFGGGIVHFCGRGDHFVERLAQIPGLNGVDLSQPHLNNMDRVFAALPDRGINLYTAQGDYSICGHEGRRIMQY